MDVYDEVNGIITKGAEGTVVGAGDRLSGACDLHVLLDLLRQGRLGLGGALEGSQEASDQVSQVKSSSNPMKKCIEYEL